MLRPTRALVVVSCLATCVAVAASQCVPPFGARRRIVTVVQGVSGTVSTEGKQRPPASGQMPGAFDLGSPRDLQFHPLTGDLWVASASADGRLNGNFIISHPGTVKQTTTLLRERIAFHYMDNVAAFAISTDGRALFTCQESLNTYTDLSFPNYFQGPTAFQVYPCKGGYGRGPASKCVGAQNAPNCAEFEECDVGTVMEDGKPCTGDGCTPYLIHSDMNHEAPLCMGIAYDTYAKTAPSKLLTDEQTAIPTWNRTRTEGNVVWYMDGLRGRLMRFDMDELHGPRIMDHRKANMRRYVDVHLTRRPGVPGHMVVDSASEHLYISDTGAKRILRVKTTSGKFHRGAMCSNHQCYGFENRYWTCGVQRQDDRASVKRFANESECRTSSECALTPDSCRRDIDNLCDPAKGGWCEYGMCKGRDGLGCYTTFTEMGYNFEYELWGKTEYEVFSTEVKSPSGIALTPDGRLLVADYDSGDIFSFDKTATLLNKIATGSHGVTALELQCSNGGSSRDTDCKLWFTNIIDRTVSYISIDAPCPTNDASSLPRAPSLKQACMADDEPCKKDRDATDQAFQAELVRPSFEAHNGAEWQERMVVPFAYGKDCTNIPNAASIFRPCTAANCAAEGMAAAGCVGTVKCRVGADGCNDNVMGGTCSGGRLSDADVERLKCPDRVDCSTMNLDLLVMAGYWCHPCLPNPCMNNGMCKHAAPWDTIAGFTFKQTGGFKCQCMEGYSGRSCEVNTRVPACDALKASGGAYTPANLCGVASSSRAGQTCTLQCSNTNMVRVATGAHAIVPVSGTPVFALPPFQTDLLQRTCVVQSSAGQGSKWSGLAATCACRPRYFGADCTLLVLPTAEKEMKVGPAGGDVMLEGGHGVKIPSLAMATEAIVSASVYKSADMGAGMPTLAKEFRAVSPLLELLPHGIHFAKPVRISVTVDTSLKVKEKFLALFFWDDMSSAWVEVPGSQVAAGTVQGDAKHFSRWVVLEKPEITKQGLHYGAWIGIAVGILVAIGAAFFVAYRMSTRSADVDMPLKPEKNLSMDEPPVFPSGPPLQPMTVRHYQNVPTSDPNGETTVAVSGRAYGSWAQGDIQST